MTQKEAVRLLKKRVIISLLINDGELYRTKQFVPDYQYTQNFVTVDSIDELFIIDITRGGRSEKFTKYVKRIVDNCFVPITVGGHFRTIEDIQWALNEFGADKVLINAEVQRQDRGGWSMKLRGLIEDIVLKYGSQMLVVGLDVREDNAKIFNDGYKCYWDQGVRPMIGHPVRRAIQYAKEGAGEIFLQSIDRDGSLAGYDLEILKEVTSAVNVPVVIGGGCGNWSHMREAFEAGADGCSTSNIFHFTETTIRSWKLKLQEAGVPVRVE